MDAANDDQSELRVVRPSRFGNGEYMTVAKALKDYGRTDEKGLLDLEKTVQVLKEAEMHLKQAFAGLAVPTT